MHFISSQSDFVSSSPFFFVFEALIQEMKQPKSRHTIIFSASSLNLLILVLRKHKRLDVNGR